MRLEIFVLILILILISQANASLNDEFLNENGGLNQDNLYPGAAGSSSPTDISHQSVSLNLEMDSLVSGTIKPIKAYNGRTIAPLQSCYFNAAVKNFKLKESTSARQGNYSSQEAITGKLKYINPSDLELVRIPGSNEYYARNTPSSNVNMIDRIEYSGKGINDNEFMGNNQADVFTNFLYNTNYSKERAIGIRALNIRVIMINLNDSTKTAREESNKELTYSVAAHSTGIADLEYRQSLPANTSRGTIAVNEGYRRYYGDFNTSEKLDMTLVSPLKAINPTNISDDDEGWLSCCPGTLPIGI